MTIFESGALNSDASIVGNNNDEDKSQFEPHYKLLERPDQVQIYKTIHEDPAGDLTTGLLTAVQFSKDNRILPKGFDKKKAETRITVHGRATEDGDSWAVATGYGTGSTFPLSIEVELLNQPIAHRWAKNLEQYPEAEETQRFSKLYGLWQATPRHDWCMPRSRWTKTIGAEKLALFWGADWPRGRSHYRRNIR